MVNRRELKNIMVTIVVPTEEPQSFFKAVANALSTQITGYASLIETEAGH